MLRARQQTQARFESFLQDAVAEERYEKSSCDVCKLVLSLKFPT